MKRLYEDHTLCRVKFGGCLPCVSAVISHLDLRSDGQWQIETFEQVTKKQLREVWTESLKSSSESTSSEAPYDSEEEEGGEEFIVYYQR